MGYNNVIEYYTAAKKNDKAFYVLIKEYLQDFKGKKKGWKSLCVVCSHSCIKNGGV